MSLIKYIRCLKPSKILIMNIDNNLFYFLILSFMRVKLYGILFAPLQSFHKSSVRHLFKVKLIKALLYRKSIIEIFNIERPEYSHWKVTRQKELLIAPNIDLALVQKKTTIESHHQRIRFSIIGFIQARKGPFLLLDTIRYLLTQNPILLDSFKFQIIGVQDGEVKNRLKGYKDILNDERVEINIDDKYLSEDEYFTHLTNTDYNMLLYSQFYASSGVLLQSAQYGVPIVCGNEGIINYLVTKFHLGYTIPLDVKALANKMIAIKENRKFHFTPLLRDMYIRNRLEKYFGEPIVRALL